MASSAQPGQPETAAPERSYAKLVEEEIPIQRTNLPINGGLPSCITMMDNFLLCFGASLSRLNYCDMSLTPSLLYLAVGQQFTSLYRYGTARDCSAKWDDFKYCLANRSSSEEEKTEDYIRRRAEHWAERRAGPSSEDIWKAKKLH